MKLKRQPTNVRGLAATVEGWWYENPKSIDVYLHDRETGRTVKGRIHRTQLADYLRRSKPTTLK